MSARPSRRQGGSKQAAAVGRWSSRVMFQFAGPIARQTASPFACSACGNPAIEPPREFTDDAPIRCKGCGEALGTWGDLKRRTMQVLMAEATPGPGAPLPVSADPLCTAPPVSGL
ncbi:MAG TPA: hypothetical protein VIL65_09010 [Beijerinckiaceae bacterium]